MWLNTVRFSNIGSSFFFFFCHVLKVEPGGNPVYLAKQVRFSMDFLFFLKRQFLIGHTIYSNFLKLISDTISVHGI